MKKNGFIVQTPPEARTIIHDPWLQSLPALLSGSAFHELQHPGQVALPRDQGRQPVELLQIGAGQF